MSIHDAIQRVYSTSPNGERDDAVTDDEQGPIIEEVVNAPQTPDSFRQLQEVAEIRFRSVDRTPDSWVRDRFFDAIDRRHPATHASTERRHVILGHYAYPNGLERMTSLVTSYSSNLHRFFTPRSENIRPDLFIWRPNPAARGNIPLGEAVAGGVMCWTAGLTGGLLNSNIAAACRNLQDRLGAQVPERFNVSRTNSQLQARGIFVPSQGELTELQAFFRLVAGENRFEIQPGGLMILPRVTGRVRQPAGTLMTWTEVSALVSEAQTFRTSLPEAVVRAYGSTPRGFISIQDYPALLRDSAVRTYEENQRHFSELLFLDPTTGRHSDALRTSFIERSLSARIETLRADLSSGEHSPRSITANFIGTNRWKISVIQRVLHDHQSGWIGLYAGHDEEHLAAHANDDISLTHEFLEFLKRAHPNLRITSEGLTFVDASTEQACQSVLHQNVRDAVPGVFYSWNDMAQLFPH